MHPDLPMRPSGSQRSPDRPSLLLAGRFEEPTGASTGRRVLCALAILLGMLTAQCDAAAGVARIRIEARQQCSPNGTCSKHEGWGSAVAVGKLSGGEWLFLSAAHNFEQTTPYNASWMHIRGRWQRVAKHIVRAQRELDVSLVAVAEPQELRTARLADRDAADGDWIEVCGFPGTTMQHSLCEGVATGPTCGRVRCPIVPGWSGGGVFNKSGDLVGIIWGGMPEGECHWTPVSAIKEILAAKGLLEGCDCAQPSTPPPAADPPSCPDNHADAIAGLDARLAAIEARLALLTPPDTAAITREITGLRQELHDLKATPTPIRVWRDDGTLAGEAETHLFQGGAIDLRFNPRVVVEGR